MSLWALEISAHTLLVHALIDGGQPCFHTDVQGLYHERGVGRDEHHTCQRSTLPQKLSQQHHRNEAAIFAQTKVSPQS